MKAAADGLLDESTTGIEFKQELARGPSANKKLAAELASLAVDGGRLIIGIVDPKNRSGPTPADALCSQPLDGLIERIESIARSIPDPPLPVSCSPIQSAADPDLGFVVVDVHPSIDAPHLVDGKPYGRNGSQKAVLSHAEVVRLVERRPEPGSSTQVEIDELALRFQYKDDHGGRMAENRPGGAIHFVAVPLLARRDCAFNGWSSHRAPVDWLATMIRKAASPSLRTLPIVDRRYLSKTNDGILVASTQLEDGAPNGQHGWGYTDAVEVTYDSTLRIFSPTATLYRAVNGQVRHYLNLWGISHWTYLAAGLTGLLGEEVDYLGQWDLRLRLIHLEASEYGRGDNFDHIRRFGVYRHDGVAHESTHRASTAELVDTPGYHARRLLERFLRPIPGIKAQEWYQILDV